MARPVYPYELDDPDFSWLISRFREEHPEYLLLDVVTLPLILIKVPEVTAPGFVPALPMPTGQEESLADLEDGDL
jgi:hypothetical protein